MDKQELDGRQVSDARPPPAAFLPTASDPASASIAVSASASSASTAPAPAMQERYEALVSDGLLEREQLNEAVLNARRSGLDLESVLMQHYRIGLAQIGAALARFSGLPYEPWRAGRSRPQQLFKNLRKEYLAQHHWLPLADENGSVVILALDPDQVRAARVVNTIFPRHRLQFMVTTRREFMLTLEQFYADEAPALPVTALLADLQDEEEDSDIGAGDLAAASQNELVRLVNRIVTDAHAQGVSDIHIEPAPGKEKTVIRFRKDGALQAYIDIPASYRKALTARIKIMADLDISERRRPQDGKIRFRKYGPLDIELRVATMPTAGGLEDMVLRLLSVGSPVPLASLGMTAANLAGLKRQIGKSHGIFFVCGPTGAGKTTTMHSLLQHLNKPDTKIWTAEDPVEITQKGLRQVQVNRKTGLDFATVMRAFLRADPDIIMVGEMRDRETVAIGIEASLTGHLVFATLHTNSAPESIQRLLDMGMDPYNFSDALLAILAQRLARRLCMHCRQAYRPDAAELQELAQEYCEEFRGLDSAIVDAAALPTPARLIQRWQTEYGGDQGLLLYRAGACAACTEGYRGRVGLHELMTGSERLKQLIARRAPHAALMACALEEGMRTLKMDGIEKVLAGQTDLKQVRHVCSR